MADEDAVDLRVCHIEYWPTHGEEEGKTFADIFEEVQDLFRLHDLNIEAAVDGPMEECDCDECRED